MAERGIWGEPVIEPIRLPRHPDLFMQAIVDKINEIVEAQNEVAAKTFGIAETNNLWGGD